MNKITTITTKINGVDEMMVEMGLLITVKVRRVSPIEEESIDPAMLQIITSVIEGETRMALATNSYDNVYFHTYRFIKEIYDYITLKIDQLDYYIVDIHIDDITDNINYGDNINGSKFTKYV